MRPVTTEELFCGATGVWMVLFVTASLQEWYGHGVPVPVVAATAVVAGVCSVWLLISDHTARTYGVDY